MNSAAKLDELQLAEAIPLHGKCRQLTFKHGVLNALPNETLQEFLDRVKPSQTSASSSISWIYVPGSHMQVTIDDDAKPHCVQELRCLVENWAQQMNRLAPSKVAKESAIVSANIFALAKYYNYGSGKFLISCDATTIDEIWSRVARATSEGKLGSGAKVSVCQQSNNPHVLCIYVECFWDEAKIYQILCHLSHMNLHAKVFKADIFSCLRFYDLKALHLHSFLYNHAAPC